MTEGSKAPESDALPRQSSAEHEILAEARGNKHETIVASIASPVAEAIDEKHQSQATAPDAGMPADQPGHLAAGVQAAPPPREQPEIPKDRGTVAGLLSPGPKPPHRHRKHRRSSHKQRPGSDDKADGTGQAGTAHAKRRKSRIAEDGFHLNEDHKPSHIPPACPSQGGAPTRNAEGITSAEPFRPVDTIPSEAAGLRKIGSPAAYRRNRVNSVYSVASTTLGSEREIEDDIGAAGVAGTVLGSPTGESEAEVLPTVATDGAGSVYVDGDLVIPSGTEVAGHAKVNTDSALRPVAEVYVNAKANAESGIDLALQGEGSPMNNYGRDNRQLQQMRRRSSVRIVTTEPEQPSGQGSGVLAETILPIHKSKAARPGRIPLRKSDGDLRSLYSLVALKDLATTLWSESPDRVQQSSQYGDLHDQERNMAWTVWLSITIGVAIILLLLIWGGLKVYERKICASSSCAQLSKTFEGVLNYSVDPCVDLDAFVCSKALRHSSGGKRGPRSLVAQLLNEYELSMVQLFLDGKTTFAASRVLSELLRDCTSSHDAPPSVDRFEEFFGFVSVPWPFEPFAEPEVHPLEAVFTLSLKWGIDAWFRAYVHTGEFSDAPVLFIEGSDQASSWLDFVYTLEKAGRREKYFQLFYDQYNATLPESESITRRLATEKEVLSILDAVRSPAASTRSIIARLAKVAAQVRNSTVDNWLESVTMAPGGAAVNEQSLVSVQDVRVLQAVDQLLSNYTDVDLTEHLSWWLVQMLTVVGWPQGYVIIAGSREAAVKELKAECYRTMAGRFGLLLASESAVEFFTQDSRREVRVFLRGLLDFLGAVAAKVPWLSDKTKMTIARRIQDLDVTLWPLNVDSANETLWQLYSDFCVSCKQDNSTAGIRGSPSASPETPEYSMLMDYWLDNSIKFWGLTDAQREDMQMLWQDDALEALRYEPWSNRLRVSHVAMRSPFFHPASTELLHANFGGLGAAFLASALQMFVPPVEDIDPDVSLEVWPEIDGFASVTSSLNCSTEFLPNLRDIAALGLAWHALKGTANASSEDDSTRNDELAIKDEKNVVHTYSGDQVFFLTYCRSRCTRSRQLRSTRGLDCNEAVRRIGDFGRVFNCAPGSPMVPKDACYVSDFF